ncbi:MAG TPA: hypothetical protein ENN47_12215 [Mesotoga infera]|uniref:Uncharacterized protein n=1 Tax=Mesotoga infera TaxID=1236046 RepID=A0A7C1D0D2_9BACT|nr:hypothetical protein [Mesotoga infera]
MKKILLLSAFAALVMMISSCWPGSFPVVPKTLLIDDVHKNFYSSNFPFDEEFEELISEFQLKGYTVSLASDVGFLPENYGAVQLQYRQFSILMQRNQVFQRFSVSAGKSKYSANGTPITTTLH